jgi:SAM-dependent methyltransferase
MGRKIADRPYNAESEKKVYDESYYHNHTQYYEKGIAGFVNFLINNFRFDSIADVGCGTGAFVSPFQTMANMSDTDYFKVIGFDFSVGAKEVQFLKPENYIEADLTVPGSTIAAKDFDIVMSLEVYEHLLPAFEETYLRNIFDLNPKHVVISCAAPGQWGRHHVNCIGKEGVQAKVGQMFPNYKVNEELTSKFAEIPKLASFYRKNTTIFDRIGE